jgi:hypothetical protein
MPKSKLYTALIGIEEIALGSVVRILHNTPGIAKVDLLLGDTKQAADHAKNEKKANGHANGEDKPRRKRVVKDISGIDFIVKTLAKHKGAMKQPAIKDAFDKDGRAPGSAPAVIHNAKKEGLVQNVARGEGYQLTKRGRDKARYV